MRFATSRRLRHRSAEINLIPLIDLFLNILVFFIVTTTFASTESFFFVDLPEASAAGQAGERKLVWINVGSAGEISVDRKIVTMEELKANLETIPAEKRATIPVVIRADRESKHGSVVTVIDLVRQQGLQNVGIATKSPTNR
ncbi:MAG TPA: biopolymer transporter ExbD [Bdellovibrionota bacterium]|nr:biopolymer transporter ExbD [Bdellovibrionota bacterium]